MNNVFTHLICFIIFHTVYLICLSRIYQKKKYISRTLQFSLPICLSSSLFHWCDWCSCHLQRCVMLNLSPLVAGACKERKKKVAEEKKWTEEWFVVSGSCSFGKCNGRRLFKVSSIHHKCSLQMDTTTLGWLGCSYVTKIGWATWLCCVFTSIVLTK